MLWCGFLVGREKSKRKKIKIKNSSWQGVAAQRTGRRHVNMWQRLCIYVYVYYIISGWQGETKNEKEQKKKYIFGRA
jgi:hypothetical protein